MYYSNVQGNVFHVLRKYGHALVEWGFEYPTVRVNGVSMLHCLMCCTVPYSRQGATKGSGDLNRQLKVM